jgi:hypothetical protein
MMFNFDSLTASGFVFGVPPLMAAAVVVAAMLILWISSKLLRYAQLGLGALAVFFILRFAFGGGFTTATPVQASDDGGLNAPAVAQTSPTNAPTTTSPLGATAPAGASNVHIDSTGLTIHVPFGDLQSVQTLLENNQTEIQRELVPAQATDTHAGGR